MWVRGATGETKPVQQTIKKMGAMSRRRRIKVRHTTLDVNYYTATVDFPPVALLVGLLHVGFPFVPEAQEQERAQGT